MADMKPVRFLGDSLKRLREFPEDAKHDIEIAKERYTELMRVRK